MIIFFSDGRVNVPAPIFLVHQHSFLHNSINILYYFKKIENLAHQKTVKIKNLPLDFRTMT